MDETLLAEQLDCFARLLRAPSPPRSITVTPLTGQEMTHHAESLGNAGAA
jgi:glycerol-3-phosphate O-acyltransferase